MTAMVPGGRGRVQWQVTWSLPLRVVLAALWIAGGLEKFGVRWPAWLAGRTASVTGVLEAMVDQAPFPWFGRWVETVLLPAGDVLAVPVGLFEVALGLALATGFWLGWAALLGAVLEALPWVGMLLAGWPLQYPLLVLAHLALAMPLLRGHSEQPGVWLATLRLVVGAIWAYKGGVVGIWYFPLGLLIMLGLGSRWLALAGLVLMWGPLRTEVWGLLPWTYYVAAAAHLALVLAADRAQPAVVGLLPERWRRLTA